MQEVDIVRDRYLRPETDGAIREDAADNCLNEAVCTRPYMLIRDI